MVEVESKHPAGSVGYISANNPRYHSFYDSLARLQVPKGTRATPLRASTYNAAFNRNDIIGRFEGEWLLLLDDDHCFRPEALLQMLDRNVDIVSALYARRYPPFETVVYRYFDPANVVRLFTWDELSEMSGLNEVEATGTGGLLVRRKVFDAIGSPWFRVGQIGQLPSDSMNEDTLFCHAVKKAGFKIFLDLDVVFGHLTESLILPIKHDGRYVVRPMVSNTQWHS